MSRYTLSTIITLYLVIVIIKSSMKFFYETRSGGEPEQSSASQVRNVLFRAFHGKITTVKYRGNLVICRLPWEIEITIIILTVVTKEIALFRSHLNQNILSRSQARRSTGDVVGGLPPETSRGLRRGPAQGQRTEVGRIRSCCQGWTGLDDCCVEHGQVAPGGRERSGSTRQRLATRGPSSIQRATPARG